MKYSKVFVIAFPFLHCAKGDRPALMAQYKWIVRSIEKNKDAVLVKDSFGNYPGERSEWERKLSEYADKRLGKRFLEKNILEKEDSLAKRLTGILDHSKEIRIAPCGELLKYCGQGSGRNLAKKLCEMGFKVPVVVSKKGASEPIPTHVSLVGSSIRGRDEKPVLSRKEWRARLRKKPKLF